MSKIIEIEEFGIIVDLFSEDFSTDGAWAYGNIASDMMVEEIPDRSDT